MKVRDTQLHNSDFFADDNDLKNFVVQRWQSKDKYKPGLEKIWLDICACYEGCYDQMYDVVARRFNSNSNIPSWRKRLAINLMLPIIRSSVAKHLRNRPIWDVIPASENIEDINIAYDGRRVLQSYWYQYSLNYEFIDLLLWIALTGNGFLYVHWDPNEGQRKEFLVEDFIDLNLMQQAQNEAEMAIVLTDAQQKYTSFVELNGSPTMPIGEACCRVISPFDMLFPWTCRLQDSPWLIFSQIRSLDYYADMGHDIDKFTRPEATDGRYYYFTQRMQNLFNLNKGAESSNTDPVPDKETLEQQLWVKPCRKYPRGFVGVIAGGEIVSRSEIPYNHQKYPFVHFTEQRSPGKIWGFSKASQTVELVREYNRAVSDTLEIKNLMAKPKIMVSATSRIPQHSWTSEPGEIVEYKGMIAPQPWVPPPIPRYIFELMGMFRRDIDDIVAQRDATKGYNPPGVRSALALENLQAADEGELAIAGLVLDTGFSLTGRLLLSTIDQFTREQRISSYEGEGNRLQSVSLKPNSLRGNTGGADYFNVRVTQFSQFGLSRSGQLEFLKVLLQYNIFQANDRNKILKFISMGYFADEIDEYKTDRTNAHLENLMMASGQPVNINVSDHHTTHKEEHKRFMKENFNRFPPKIQQIFVLHLKLTELFEVMDVVKPQILAQKATMLVAAQEGILPLVMGNGRQPEQSNTR